jgi:hypothetical protein
MGVMGPARRRWASWGQDVGDGRQEISREGMRNFEVMELPLATRSGQDKLGRVLVARYADNNVVDRALPFDLDPTGLARRWGAIRLKLSAAGCEPFRRHRPLQSTGHPGGVRWRFRYQPQLERRIHELRLRSG